MSSRHRAGERDEAGDRSEADKQQDDAAARRKKHGRRGSDDADRLSCEYLEALGQRRGGGRDAEAHADRTYDVHEAPGPAVKCGGARAANSKFLSVSPRVELV